MALFTWDSFDVTSYLPINWQEELIQFTRNNMKLHTIHPGNETSRETDSNAGIPTFIVSGNIIKEYLPWLYQFYEGHGLNMMQKSYITEKFICAHNPLYAINLQAAYDVDDSGIWGAVRAPHRLGAYRVVICYKPSTRLWWRVGNFQQSSSYRQPDCRRLYKNIS